MGWNSWNHFAKQGHRQDVRTAADALVSTGMKDAGYVYINIDDTWEGERDAQGNIQANSKFPDMKALADYVHSKGLKIGIYSGPGPRPAAVRGSPRPRRAGRTDLRRLGNRLSQVRPLQFSRHHEKERPTIRPRIQMMLAAYEKMHDALKKPDAPWSSRSANTAGTRSGNGHRESAAISGAPPTISMTLHSMANIGFAQAGLAKYAGPGHWNDPDMLEVGNGKMTRRRIHHPHEPVGDPCRAAACRQRSFANVRRNQCDPHQQDVIAIDQDPPANRATASAPRAPLKSGPSRSRMAPSPSLSSTAATMRNRCRCPCRSSASPPRVRYTTSGIPQTTATAPGWSPSTG